MHKVFIFKKICVAIHPEFMPATENRTFIMFGHHTYIEIHVQNPYCNEYMYCSRE